MNVTRGLRVAWWLVPFIYAVLFARPSVRLPGDALGWRSFHTPPLGPDLRLGQTFTMTGDGLQGIEIFPAPVDGTSSGTVRFELREVVALSNRDRLRVLLLGDSTYAAELTLPNPEAQVLVRRADVAAERLLELPSYTWEFMPIRNSKDRTYRVDLTAAVDTHVGFWATKGERYSGGSLRANGRERWADLAFGVYAPAPRIWTRLMTLRSTNPIRAYVAIAALVAVWLLLGVVVRLP